MQPDDFQFSFDARDWAKAFVGYATANPAIATDEGTMVGWFANAIMRGYDEGRKAHPGCSCDICRLEREDMEKAE